MAATKLTKHHLINVPGGFVTLDVYGQEGEGGIPALYIHGGPGGNKKSFQPMAERIAEDRTVYLYDQIGCDDKSHTGEESLWVPERYVEELNAVIAAIGAPPSARNAGQPGDLRDDDKPALQHKNLDSGREAEAFGARRGPPH